MPLPACKSCGTTEPRMIGLMTVFFGEFVDLPPEPGYFYLCPACFVRDVEPYLDEDQIRDSLLLREERRKQERSGAVEPAEEPVGEPPTDTGPADEEDDEEEQAGNEAAGDEEAPDGSTADPDNPD